MQPVYIKNKQGMAALCTKAAVTDDDRIAFLAIAGALTAVKAIWASVLNRKTPLFIGRSYKPHFGDRDVEYLVTKQSPAQGVHQWVMYPDPGPDAPYLVLIPLDFNGMDAEAQLVEVLNRHTLWPVKPEWSSVLWNLGVEKNLVTPLTVHGGLEWAYTVCPVGWDDVIDEAAKTGRLTFR